MQTDLVTCISGFRAFLGEGLERMPWDEPGGLDVVFLE
jgi:hypothetical protein